MPLFSEHISNMYYSGTPSYTSPSYGYKSSYNPLGPSYSASYLSPGGSYGNHSSLSSYSRTPLTSHRWIPGLSRSYSPMLTPISERGAASPIRINSPRRIPISKRCYGTPSYIQRPININTESIDVSRDRYRAKPDEPPPRPTRASLPQPQNDEPVMETENSPFMPRIDGKPETGIDSSPGKQRSTIKRGRTVVRFHTIKRKDKDSPRKPMDTSKPQDNEIKKRDPQKNLEYAVMPEEPKESVSWREKLSDDLIYIDKKEKKSLGTKLVEKFIVPEKDSKQDKSDVKSGGVGEVMKIAPEALLLRSEVASTSKSPDRRYSMELLAEQSSLFDSLIRGENLSTATLDLSKVGIDDETKNKLVSSDSIKRRKTDDKGNPLKTTKSDHSLHDNLSKSLRGNKDSKVFTKRRSLKKSQSGGSIHRLDSITEFPKKNVHVDLPIIQENKFSPKQVKTEQISPQQPKTEQKPKLRNKITGTVEVSPPTSPLKFRIENVIVEEKLNHTPKKEISFSYDVDETSIQDVTVKGPKTTLKRCKERNSIKKKSKKVVGNDPISPEPDDGNFWAKIGKRETVYLKDRKQNIEAAKEENQKSHFWFTEEEESKEIREDSAPNNCNVLTENSNDSINLLSSALLLDSEVNKNPTNDNIGEVNKGILETVSTKVEKSPENIEIKNSNTHNSSLKEITTKPITEHEEQKPDSKEMFCDDKEIKEDVIPLSEEINKTENVSDLNLSLRKQSTEQPTPISKINSDTPEMKKDSATILSVEKSECSDEKFNLKTRLEDLPKSGEKSSAEVSSSVENPTRPKTTHLNINLIINSQADSENKNETKDLNIIAQTVETEKANISPDLCEEASPENTEILLITAPIAKTESKIHKRVEKITKLQPDKIEPNRIDKANIDSHSFSQTEIKPLHSKSILQVPVKPEDKEKDSKTISEKNTSIKDSTVDVGLSLSTETKPTVVTAAIIQTQVECLDKDLMSLTENVEQIKPILVEPVAVIQSATTSTESEAKVNSVSSLQMQAKIKVESKKTESLAKHKRKDAIEDIDTGVSKKVSPDSTKKNVLKTTTETNSKKKVKKVQIKVSDKNKDIKLESTSSAPKENICDTCKKSLGSGSSLANKLIVERVVEPSTSKQLQEKDKLRKIDAKADKPIINVQIPKLELDNSAADLSNSDGASASASQKPAGIETTDIPNNTVASDTNQLQNSKKPEEKTGEENKADKNTKGDGDLLLKQTSIKEVKPRSKKPIKEEKPVKPLIATPRPLLKRAPQVIHSDSSESSSDEDSSEEDQVSDASENSGEFYECENNPDGRTSTGSNDSGFDSSAPTSPASFLQIKKGAGDSPGPSSSSASAQLPATDVVDSELELEQSTAYGLFRKTGRFTPPARSIPRFRKYNIEDFQFIKVLGKGSFGKVLLAELRDTEYYYAVKCLKKDVVLEDDDVECTLIERKVLALGTNHPYLCHLFATFQTDSHLFFVMEYLNGGDLMFHIQQSGRFPEPRARFYAAEIVSGLKFLHKRGIVYRDLKLDNILLDFDGHVRIADFGMCKLQIYLDKTADTFCGTPDYMAPEIIKGLKYNQTVDWWSFGVLLYEMLIGQSPFSGCDEDELFWSICNEMPSYPRFLSSESLTILTRLLDKDARTRLGGTECMHGDVREQDFFHAVHWDKLERRELETPFKPRVRHPLDTQYFDRAFTGERPRLTAVEPHVLRSMDQEPFRGFSYTNPNATDR